MIKRAVLFDFGGVFMKTVNYNPRHAWDDRLGLPHDSVERIVHGSESWRAAQIGQLDINDYWADVGRQLRLEADSITQLAVDYFSGDELDIALVNYAQQLRKRGHAVALLSNDSLALVGKLETLGIRDLFEPLMISAQMGVMKPNPVAFQMALERLGRAAAEVIFIDDMPVNIESARELGFHTIHYTTTPALLAALEGALNIEA